jgi:hypothetical protein
MITEDYVSFETAKLLKEKGFDFCCEFQYINCLSGCPFLTDIHDDAGCYYKNSEIGQDEYSAPTLQMTMKWLREVHKLHIEVNPAVFDYKHDDIHDGWSCEIMHLSSMAYNADFDFQKKYSTYEEACEVAIKYCLEKLI